MEVEEGVAVVPGKSASRRKHLIYISLDPPGRVLKGFQLDYKGDSSRLPEMQLLLFFFVDSALVVSLIFTF